MCAARVGRCYRHSYPQERELELLGQLEGHSTSQGQGKLNKVGQAIYINQWVSDAPRFK